MRKPRTFSATANSSPKTTCKEKNPSPSFNKTNKHFRTDLNKNSSNSTGSNGFPGALQQFTVPEAPNGKSDKSNVDRLRSHDIALLNKLGVKYICDLMVEYRKIKFGLSVCSSEKADSQGRYNSAGLEVVSIPYPGCEFFKDFRDHKRCGKTTRSSQKKLFSHHFIREEAHVRLDVAASKCTTQGLQRAVH